MSIRACLVSLLAPCLLAGASTAAAGPPGPQAIDTAIERGVAYVLGEQRPNGTWGPSGDPLGHTALVTYTLLHCGVAEDDGTQAGDRLRRALRRLESSGPGRAGKRDLAAGTYATSLLLLTLRARGRAVDRPRMQRLADLLAFTQAENGQWWYQDKNLAPGRTGDNSNTQFATLALGAAHGEGLSVSPKTLERAERWWLETPQPDGGFGYCSGGSRHSAATASMTAAGIACLAIHRFARGGPLHPQETKATEHLARVFSVKRNDGPPQGRPGQRQRNSGRGWLHYYLWTVERAMVLAGHERLGGVDWFAEGAARLIETQHTDGSWRQEHPLYATCFALLFLTRAADPPRAFTPRKKPPAKGPQAPVTPAPAPPGEGPPPPVPEGDGEPAAGEGPAGTVADWLEATLPPGELARRCRDHGPSSLRPLVRALSSRDRALRQRAFEALDALLPAERTFRVDRHPLPRGRLDLWLRQNADVLVLENGRFRAP